MAGENLTAERARELFNYEPVAGKLIRLVRTSSCTHVGDVVGSRHSEGYLTVCVDGNQYFVHRLIWLWVYGEWPPYDIDHRNGKRADNRFPNLRMATRSENNQNKSSALRNSQTGILGVSWNRRNQKWYAQLVVNGKHAIHSCHGHIEDAIAARRAAEMKYHPFKRNTT